MPTPRADFLALFADVWICLGEVPTATLVRKCRTMWPAHRRADLIELLRIRSQQYGRTHPAKVAALDLLIGELLGLAEEDPE